MNLTMFRARSLELARARVHVETVQALTIEDASRLLAMPGKALLSIEPSSTVKAEPRREVGRAAKLDVAWWCRELRTLVFAGMTVVEAIETLCAQPLGEARAEVHSELLGQLHEGRSLSSAMEATGAFPTMLIAGVRASERTSALIEALDDYLRYHDMLERLRKQVVSAALYPAVVVMLGLAICIFLLAIVMPRFSQMYTSLRGDLTLTTRMLMGLSDLLSRHWLLLGAAAIAVAVSAALAWERGDVGRWGVRLIDKVGPLRRHVDEFWRAKLYHSLALMFRGGYSLDDALAHCRGLGLGQRLSLGLAAARDDLAKGRRVSAAFGDAGLTDAVSQRLLAVGERTGNFDRVLQTIADRHAANFATFVERTTRLVEPLLLLMVALMVGSIVVLMYMPVFDIASSVR